MAVAEDLMGGVDVTSAATIPLGQRSVGHVRRPRGRAWSPGCRSRPRSIEIVCGDAASEFVHLVADGDRVGAGTEVARVTAPTRLLLTAERTRAEPAVPPVGGRDAHPPVGRRAGGHRAASSATPARRRPGLRALEKYAVRCGGGVNHRMGLSDMALVKDNHVAAAGGVAAAFELVRALEATIPVEIEVDTLDGLREAIEAGADEVLLDNFDTRDDARGRRAPRRARAAAWCSRRAAASRSRSARRVAETGVDYIAVGELTHSARVLDLGLDLRDD